MTDYFMKAEGGKYGLSVSGLSGEQVSDEVKNGLKTSIGFLVGVCVAQGSEGAKITHKGVKIEGEDKGDWEVIIRKIN